MDTEQSRSELHFTCLLLLVVVLSTGVDYLHQSPFCICILSLSPAYPLDSHTAPLYKNQTLYSLSLR